MNIHPQFYDQIADGSKTVEIRLASKKRLKMQPKDTIRFFRGKPAANTRTPMLVKHIKKIKLYYSFESMLEHESAKSIGDPTKEACLVDLKRIYHWPLTSMVMAIHFYKQPPK